MFKNRVQRYSIRKLSVGAASVLIGVAFLTNSNNVKADEAEKDASNKQPAVVDESKQAAQTPAYDKDKIVVEKADTANADSKQVEEKAAADANESEKHASAVNTEQKEDNKQQVNNQSVALKENKQDNKQPAALKENKEDKVKADDQAKDAFNVTIKSVDDINHRAVRVWNAKTGKWEDKADIILTGAKKGTRIASIENFHTIPGYRLLNPEVLDQYFEVSGDGVAFLKVKDNADVVLHYAKLADLEVDYVNEANDQLLTRSIFPSWKMTTDSWGKIHGDEKAPAANNYQAVAIDIPGYELVSAPVINGTYNEEDFAQKDNKKIIFKYKKIIKNDDSVALSPAPGEEGNRPTFGAGWNVIPGSFNISGVYGITNSHDNGDVEKRYQELIDRYERQGSTYVGTAGFVYNDQMYNYLSFGHDIHLVPNKPVTVQYVDEDGNKLAADDIISFNKNNPDQTNNGVNEQEYWTPAGEWTTKPKDIDGYTLVNVKGAEHGKFTVFNYITTYVYAKKVKGSVVYIDDTTGTTLENDRLDEAKVDDKISYTTADKIKYFENQGYKLISNNFKDGEEVYKNGDNKFEVHLIHETRPVTPDNPADPDKPVDPTKPNTPTPSNPNLSKSDLEKTITRTVEYKYADGSEAHESVKQSVHFVGQGIIDTVTGNLVNVDKDGNIVDQHGKITWNYESQDFASVPAIEHNGYYISNVKENNTSANVNTKTGQVAGERVTPNSQNSTIVITLTKKPEVPVAANGSIRYIDDTTGNELESATFGGTVGQKINYTTADKIARYEGQGYKLVSNNFEDGSQVYDKDAAKNIFEVHLVHATRPVTPDNPADPNKPVDPTKPNTPTPSNPNLSKSDLEKTVTRTVKYVYDDGSKTINPVEQSVHFTGQGTIDLVTGNLVDVDKDGNIVDQHGKITWNYESQDFASVPGVEHDGYYISSVKENNTNVNVDTKTGQVAGEKVTPNSQNSEIIITLTKKPEVPVAANGSIRYIDDTTGNELESATFGGTVGQKINYTTADKIARYESQGYKLVSNNFTDGTQAYDKDAAKNIFEVHLVHTTSPVNPDNPGAGYSKTDLEKTITRTVEYKYADGSDAHKPVEQSVHFVGNGTVDNVTGQLVTVENGKITPGGKITWNVTPNNSSYEEVPGVEHDGYYISSVKENNTNVNVNTKTGQVAGEKVTPNSQNSTIVITLTKKPETPVVANGSITYIDDTTGETLQSATFGGTVGQKINYTTADKIARYEGQGYKLVSNNFTDGSQAYDKDAAKNVFEVHLVRTTSPVNPDNPGAGYSKSDLAKTITRTITYVYNDGSKTTNPVQQEVKFTGHGVIDNVTGQLVTVENGKITPGGKITWTVTPNSSSYEEVPAISNMDDYYISSVKENNTNVNVDTKTGQVAGEKVTPNSQNSTIVITLTKKPEVPVAANGSIRYIDDTTGNELQSATFGGTVGQKINYTTADKIARYESQGYKLVSNNFNDGSQAYDKDAAKNIFEVHLVHTTSPVNPDNPGAGYSKSDLEKTITRTIEYKSADGSEVHESVEQEVKFTGHGVIDNVTGNLVTVDKDGNVVDQHGKITWNEGNFKKVNTPEVPNYHVTGVTTDGNVYYTVDQKTGNVSETPVTHENGDTVVTVHFAKNPQPEQPTTPVNPTTPVSPSNPTNPTSPTTPVIPEVPDENVTPHPETPVTPENPTSPSEPVEDENVTPHGQDVPGEPDTPDVPEVKDEKDPSPVDNENVQPKANKVVKTATKNLDSQNAANELPQTGEGKDDALAGLGLAFISGIALIGLAGVKKRKN